MKDHAPEITHHITEEHAKGNIFDPSAHVYESKAHQKAKEGCYANAEHPSRQEKM